MNAVGIVELLSISQGYRAADAMLKAASVDLLLAKPICPGKYVVVIAGTVAEVTSSVQAGSEIGAQYLVDELVIANIHPEVFPALSGTAVVEKVESLGIIETYSAAGAVLAADAAVKAASVNLIEVRLALGLGGKAFVTMTGSVSQVQAAVDAGARAISEKGLLVDATVIPAPAAELASTLC